MKKLLICILLSVSLQSFCQSWNGIPIQGNLQTLKTNLANKGFLFIKKQENVASFKGQINGVDYELYAYLTPISGEFGKLSVYLPKKLTWFGLKTDYEYVKGLLTEKYGESEHYEYFSDPYYEGDGYEMNAVTLEKCKYGAFWLSIEKEPNTSIMLEISEYQQVKLVYQNNSVMKKAEAELNKINKNIF